MTYLRAVLCLGVCLGLLGCDNRPAPTGELAVSSRFTGLWSVMMSGSGVPLLGATVLSFQPDGGLRLTGNYRPTRYASKDPGWVPCTEGCAKASISAPYSTLSCDLGAWWESTDDQVLELQGHCSDGEVREIQLRFPSDSSMNSQIGGIHVEVLSVGGQAGWGPFAGWSWQKCSQSSCPPGT